MGQIGRVTQGHLKKGVVDQSRFTNKNRHGHVCAPANNWVRLQRIRIEEFNVIHSRFWLALDEFLKRFAERLGFWVACGESPRFLDRSKEHRR